MKKNLELSIGDAGRGLRKKVIVLGAVVTMAATLSAQTDAKPGTDVLELSDGEKLIGHLVSASGASVIFHSDAAGDVTIEWAKVQTLKSSDKFAVPEKDTTLDKHTDLSKVPQGTVSESDQKLTVDPGNGAAPTVIPVANATNVVPQADFLNAFKTPRLDQDWHGSAGLGIDLIAATQKSRNITAAASLQRVVSGESWIDPRYKTLFDLNFADSQLSQTGKQTINTDIFHADLEHDIFLSKRLFGFGSADLLHSLAQGMKLQQTYGGGFGYVVLKDERQELDVKAAIVYIHQAFEPVAPPLANLPSKSLVGTSLGETYTRSLQHGMALKEGITLIPAFNDASAFTANFFANLAIPVSKRLGITIGGVDAYINEPPAGFKKNSFEFVTQIAYKIN
jgi:Protein of unknown function, DUF481